MLDVCCLCCGCWCGLRDDVGCVCDVGGGELIGRAARRERVGVVNCVWCYGGVCVVVD